MTLRARAGLVLAVALGVVLIGLGVFFLIGEPSVWRRLFGLREIFLGSFLLALVVVRQWRALLMLVVALLALPIVDTLAMAGPIGWPRAALANLPYELPLLVAVVLLWPLWRR